MSGHVVEQARPRITGDHGRTASATLEQRVATRHLKATLLGVRLMAGEAALSNSGWMWLVNSLRPACSEEIAGADWAGPVWGATSTPAAATAASRAKPKFLGTERSDTANPAA